MEKDVIESDAVYLRVLAETQYQYVDYIKQRLERIANKLETLEQGYKVIKEEPDGPPSR